VKQFLSLFEPELIFFLVYLLLLLLYIVSLLSCSIIYDNHEYQNFSACKCVCVCVCVCVCLCVCVGGGGLSVGLSKEEILAAADN